MLDTQYEIRTNSHVLDKRVQDLTVRPEGNPEPVEFVTIDYFFSDEFLEIHTNGKPWIRGDNIELFTFQLHLYMNLTALGRYAHKPRIHCACASWKGQRFLICGDKGAGKTTLLLRLMQLGCDIHSDEMVILDGYNIQPFPRKFYIKTGTFKLMPELKRRFADSFTYPLVDNKLCYLADPLLFEYGWDISQNQIAYIFYLENKDGLNCNPSIAKRENYLMIKDLLEQSLNFEPGFSDVLASFSKLVSTCRCYSLFRGDLDETASIILNTIKKD